MDIKLSIVGLSGIMLSSFAIAGNMGEIVSQQTHPVASLQGGYASMNSGKAQGFTGTDGDIFTYTNSGNINTGFVGVFLGGEHALSWLRYPGFLCKLGSSMTTLVVSV